MLNINTNNFTIFNIQEVYDVFDCDAFNGRALPPSLTPEMFDEISFIDDVAWALYDGDMRYRKAINTPLFNRIIDYMDSKIALGDEITLKWVTYSFHDTNIAAIQAALNLTDY